MANPRAGRQGISSMAAGNGVDESALVRETLGLKDPNRPVTLPLSKIRRDGGTQPRAALNQETVEEYAEAMEAGKKLPPATVFYDGTDYWLVDGFHRVAAVEHNQGDEYSFVVKQGTHRDAILYSFGVNDEHGLRRTNEDKRRSVMAMLADLEWQKMSSEAIAATCKVSHTFVNNLRRSLATVASQGEHGKKIVEKRTGADGREYRVKPPVSKPALVQRPAEQPAVQEAEPFVIRTIILNELGFGDRLWHELSRAVQGRVSNQTFNRILAEMYHEGLIVHSERDQAAYALADIKLHAPVAPLAVKDDTEGESTEVESVEDSGVEYATPDGGLINPGELMVLIGAANKALLALIEVPGIIVPDDRAKAAAEMLKSLWDRLTLTYDKIEELYQELAE